MRENRSILSAEVFSLESRYERSAGVLLIAAAMITALLVCLMCLWFSKTEDRPAPKDAVLVWSEGVKYADE